MAIPVNYFGLPAVDIEATKAFLEIISNELAVLSDK